MPNILLARKAATFTLAQLQDVNAIKTAISTSAAAQNYTGAALNGVAANPGPATTRLPRAFCIARSNAAGQYTTDDIVATGTDEDGNTATATITPPNVNGNDVLVSTEGLVTVTSIAVPAQGGVGGQFQFGFSDLVFSKRRPCTKVLIGANGTVHLTYEDGTLETLTTLASDVIDDLAIMRITHTTGGVAMTAEPITAFVSRSHA